jgi:hypothetical protein
MALTHRLSLNLHHFRRTTMSMNLKKSLKRAILAVSAAVLLALGSIPAMANSLTYLGTDETNGDQYTLSCGSSAGDYIVVYNPGTNTYKFYATQC